MDHLSIYGVVPLKFRPENVEKKLGATSGEKASFSKSEQFSKKSLEKIIGPTSSPRVNGVS